MFITQCSEEEKRTCKVNKTTTTKDFIAGSTTATCVHWKRETKTKQKLVWIILYDVFVFAGRFSFTFSKQKAIFNRNEKFKKWKLRICRIYSFLFLLNFFFSLNELMCVIKVGASDIQFQIIWEWTSCSFDFEPNKR